MLFLQSSSTWGGRCSHWVRRGRGLRDFVGGPPRRLQASWIRGIGLLPHGRPHCTGPTGGLRSGLLAHRRSHSSWLRFWRCWLSRACRSCRNGSANSSSRALGSWCCSALLFLLRLGGCCHRLQLLRSLLRCPVSWLAWRLRRCLFGSHCFRLTTLLSYIFPMLLSLVPGRSSFRVLGPLFMLFSQGALRRCRDVRMLRRFNHWAVHDGINRAKAFAVRQILLCITIDAVAIRRGLVILLSLLYSSHFRIGGTKRLGL